MEVEANYAFDAYRQMYYEGGVGSVYLWDLDEGFAGVVLLKKQVSVNRLGGIRYTSSKSMSPLHSEPTTTNLHPPSYYTSLDLPPHPKTIP